MAFSLPFSSSASSSSAPKRPYDVFLSFRGIDTRNTFTTYLYHTLCQKGIKTYIDEKDLERGEIISPTLLKVIEDSMISIIVLSSNYASSTWCLEELTKILECKKTKQQIVLPVFYHVDPSEVRNLRGRFGEALAKHQERFKEDPKVQKWKESLQEVASLSGEHLEDGDEYEFMHKIIEWVDSKIVKYTYELDIAEYPIGLESRLKDLNTKLEIGRNDITLMIGIYGIGGIGKTTLAKAVFNSIGHQFEARCFLANVREKSSQNDGLVTLQKQLLYELLGNFGSLNIGGIGGTNVIKHRLCSKRVLIILDDVSESCQLQKLAGNHNWFVPGSRIVVTTRDERLLTSHKVDSTYEVQGLDDNQAIQLFSWHAFERHNPDESYVELTKAIISYAKGLPLALRVLGSDLRGRSIQEWESALEKYERSPHKEIYKILKISYDGLDDNEKEIFLDIACFYKRISVEYATKILGFSSYCVIARLKEKCLININRDQYVEMHDLLHEMGKEIVQQESSKEAGKRSRLWSFEDVRHVLEENTATDSIETILLDIPEGHDHKICLDSKAFKKMKNLRLFINRNAQFSAGPEYLSNEIRVFDWPEYPSSFLPSNFHGNNLTILRMPFSLIKELGGLKSKNLTVMDLFKCKSITKIPDLSSSPNLEILYLGLCKNLVEVHDSVGFLDKLSSFLVSGCCKLRILPKRFKLRSLRVFHLGGCWNLEDFPEIECEIEFLHMLNLGETSIKELPSSIENLKGLETLHLQRSSLKELPSSILTRLNELEVVGCIDQLQSLPRIVKVDGYSQVPIHIRQVEEDGTHSMPSVVSTGEECEIAELTPTNSIIFNDAGSSSSTIIWESLYDLSLRFCCLSESNFFTNGNNYFPALVELDLSGSDIVIFPPQSVRFDRLRDLCLNNCKKLEEILPLPSSIASVEARECTSLESFALPSEILVKNNGTNFPNHLRIDLYGCHKLIPSWEDQIHSKEQNWAHHFKYISIIFPGKRIPSWFIYRKEAHDGNLCEIDVDPPHHWNHIVFYLVFAYRVGITNSIGKMGSIAVKIHDGSNSEYVYYFQESIRFSSMVSDHVLMCWTSYNRPNKQAVSRFSFECKSELLVIRRVGIHLPRLGSEFVYSNSDEKSDSSLDLVYGKRHSSISELEDDNENPNEDLGLENDDENLNERFGKRRCHDGYDCNLEFNLYLQQKRQHSSTMGIRITELENNDEHPKQDLDLELKLGL
ncbi:disease resistance protein RUN1-like [Juglans microcarpa x Juglans regia]|uniref:disease resistance protein RUN1-like n=1 Tax=Juglans microcarpa x Juglans regia TaxID=2249226 RepID=UPI001B7EE496|nr:disease resistance protein RUN1-like [Juglans microcarpa x Juglans regia]